MRVISIATRPAGPVPLNRCPCPMRARSRHKIHLQRRSSLIRRAPCRKSLPRFIGYDLGAAAQARVQYRHRGLWPLRWICQGHRRGVEPVYRGPERHRPDPGSPAPERTGNTDSAIAVTTRLVPRAERRLGQGELMHSIKRGCPGAHCSFSPGRTPTHSQQGSQGKPHGMSCCVLSFRNERI